MEVSSYI